MKNPLLIAAALFTFALPSFLRALPHPPAARELAFLMPHPPAARELA